METEVSRALGSRSDALFGVVHASNRFQWRWLELTFRLE